MRLLLLALALAACAAAADGGGGERVSIKVVDGKKKKAHRRRTVGPPAAKRTPREPDAGAPELLAALGGGPCAARALGVYEYKVCPFANVTQRQTNGAYHGVLGVFDRWLPPEDGRLTTLVYTDGDRCGTHARETYVRVECGVAQAAKPLVLVSVKEPSTCNYSVVLSSSLPCDAFAWGAPPFEDDGERSVPVRSWRHFRYLEAEPDWGALCRPEDRVAEEERHAAEERAEAERRARCECPEKEEIAALRAQLAEQAGALEEMAVLLGSL